MEKQKCKECNLEFKPKRKLNIFCSSKCSCINYRKNNKEHIKNYGHNYRIKFREDRNTKRKLYRRNNLKYIKKEREYNTNYYKNNLYKISAINLVNKELKITRNCEICGSNNNIIKHHDDYLKPLQIRFLCRICHYNIHNQLNITKGGNLKSQLILEQ